MAVQMSQVYKKIFTLRFREADPAGIMFFGNIYGICHDAFEDMIDAVGIGWNNYFRTKEFMIPLMKSEAEYRVPLRPGQKYEISVSVSLMKTSSFEMTYVISDATNPSQVCVTVKTVHVCLDAKTKSKTALPDQFRKPLETILSQEKS